MGSFVGFCMLLVSFVTEIKQKLKMIETIIDEKGKLSSETETDIKNILCKFIRLHSYAKQLSKLNISF